MNGNIYSGLSSIYSAVNAFPLILYAVEANEIDKESDGSRKKLCLTETAMLCL